MEEKQTTFNEDTLKDMLDEEVVIENLVEVE